MTEYFKAAVSGRKLKFAYNLAVVICHEHRDVGRDRWNICAEIYVSHVIYWNLKNGGRLWGRKVHLVNIRCTYVSLIWYVLNNVRNIDGPKIIKENKSNIIFVSSPIELKRRIYPVPLLKRKTSSGTSYNKCEARINTSSLYPCTELVGGGGGAQKRINAYVYEYLLSRQNFLYLYYSQPNRRASFSRRFMRRGKKVSSRQYRIRRRRDKR